MFFHSAKRRCVANPRFFAPSPRPVVFFPPPFFFCCSSAGLFRRISSLSALVQHFFFLSFFGVPFKKDCLNEDLCCAGGGEEEGRFRAVALDRGPL